MGIIDAIGSQKEIVEKIAENNEADYDIALKSNQFSLFQDASLFLNDIINQCIQAKHSYTKTAEKDHAGFEVRGVLCDWMA